MLRSIKQKLKMVHIIITYFALLPGAFIYFFVDHKSCSLIIHCYEQFSHFSIVINGSVLVTGSMKVSLLW